METENQLMVGDGGSANIHFAWLEQAALVSSYKETKLFFDYDIDKVGDMEWYFHIDITLILDNVVEYDMRSSTFVKGKDENIFKKEFLHYHIKQAFDVMKLGFEDRQQQDNKHFNIDEIFDLDKELIPFTDHILAERNYKAIGDDKEGLFNKSYTLRFYQDTNNASIIIDSLITQILFSNPHFDRLGNRDRLKHYIHTGAFFTLKTSLFQLNEDQQPLEMKWKYYIVFLLCVDCACHLLLGEHAEYLVEDLERAGDYKERIKLFLKWAEMYLSRIKQNMKETNVNIEVLYMDSDWNELVR